MCCEEHESFGNMVKYTFRGVVLRSLLGKFVVIFVFHYFKVRNHAFESF